MSDQEGASPQLVRLEASKDFPFIEAVVAHLRRRAPKLVPALELSAAVRRPKRQIYGLIKLAKSWLTMTTGESVVNVRGVGYQVSSQPRAILRESVKSGNRADGHIRAEILTFQRVKREDLKSNDDVHLWLCQQARVRCGEAMLKISDDIAPVMRLQPANAALAAETAQETTTPWEALGLDNPHDDGSN